MKNIKTNKKGVLKFCNTNIREVVLNTTYTQQGHNLHFDMCSVASNICSMQCTLCTFVPTRALQPKLACRHSRPLLLVHFGHRRELDLPTWACSFHCGNIIQSIMLPSNDKPWSCLWNHDTGGMHPNVCYN